MVVIAGILGDGNWECWSEKRRRSGEGATSPPKDDSTRSTIRKEGDETFTSVKRSQESGRQKQIVVASAG